MQLRLVILAALIGACLAQSCNKADVVFLLDDSSSIQPQNVTQIKQFVLDVMDGLGVDVGADKSHASVVMFSDAAQFLFRFNTLVHAGLNRTKDLLRNRRQIGGGTHTYRGLDLIRRVAWTVSYGARLTNDVAKICIVVTDGNSQIPAKTKEAAKKLHKVAHVFAVGVGNETIIKQEELENIASDKSSVWRAKDTTGLDKIKGSVSGAACKVNEREEEEEEVVEEEAVPEAVPEEGRGDDYVEGSETAIEEK